MKVLSPSSTTHDITFVPRFYPDSTITVELKNEVDSVVSTPTNTYFIKDGKITVRFDYTFVENDKFQMKVSKGADVVYRGKIFATTQSTQAFKLTDGIYEYE
jgi:hypothetical protein